MIKSLLPFVIFLWSMTILLGQQIIKGHVLEQHSKKPISFANIGIFNSTIGSISNEDGSFSISIPVRYTNDTLLFSALGYATRRIPLSLINSNRSLIILLSEKVTELESITVSAKKEKRKTYWLGNKFSQGGNIYADSVAAGSAMALLIENKYPAYHADITFPVFIEKAMLKISDNTLQEFKVRIRILEVDSITKLPGKDLFNENVVVTSKIKSGWLTFDLSSFNLRIDKPSFFLVFEWILEDKTRLALLDQYKQYKKLNPDKVTVDTLIVKGDTVHYYNWYNFVAGTSFGVSPIKFSLDNYQSFFRNNSFGEWKRAATILTARIEVSNQPYVAKDKSFKKELEKTTACLEKTPSCDAINIGEAFRIDNSINGVQLAVSVKGKTVVSKGLGFSDLEHNEPITPHTRFRIGSVSKTLTSAALIKLIADGKLDLDAPIQKYVPSFPHKKHPITTRQLAGHLAGIRHYSENELNDLIRKNHYTNCVEAISIFRDDSLLFIPGTQYHYSSYGWNLIGAVIEGASDENYLDYMLNNIWKPLAMTQTYGDVADSIMPNKTKFYYLTGEEAQPYDLSYKYPSGGLLSTAEDLLKFGNELLHGKYFDKKLIDKLFQTQYTSDNKPTNYGLGWNIVKDRNGHRVYYHAGYLLEGSAYLLIYPDDDIVVAFLANSRDGLSLDIQKIGELFYLF